MYSQTSTQSILHSPFRIASQPAVQSTPQPTQQDISQVSAQMEFGIIRPRDSNELHSLKRRMRVWYIGLLNNLPPPEDVYQKWETILPRLVEQLRGVTAKLDRKISAAKSITEPVLCMVGKECSSTDASKFLPIGADCPSAPVLLKPTVWIYCGGSKCKARVEEEIRPNESPLRDFLESFHSAVGFQISKKAPRPSSNISSPDSSGPFTQADELSFAVRYPLAPNIPWPAAARFTVGSTHLYSTIGGPIRVGPRYYGLTTAHGIADYLDQISKGPIEDSSDEESSDEESSEEGSLTSDVDSDTPHGSTFDESFEDMEVDEPSGSLEDMEADEPSGSFEDVEGDAPSSSRWEVSALPEILAYLGRGTSASDYLFKENAPATSDFALVDLPSHRYPTTPTVDIASSRDDLYPGEVCITSTSVGSPLNGHLLKGKSFLIMKGVVMQTMKIQIESSART
jgi:hypothetical protein